MSPSEITSSRVRDFLVDLYAEKIRCTGANPAELPDTFDFLLQGVIDSFGVLETVGALEKEFGIELDMSDLDAEQMTVLGPLSRFVAEQARARSAPGAGTGPSAQTQG